MSLLVSGRLKATAFRYVCEFGAPCGQTRSCVHRHILRTPQRKMFVTGCDQISVLLITTFDREETSEPN